MAARSSVRSDTDYKDGYALYRNENRAKYDALPAEPKAVLAQM